MHILILARGYPSEKYLRNGIFEYDQAKALAGQGHKVVFAAVDSRSIRRWRKWGFESLEREGLYIEVINIPCGRVLDWFRSYIEKWALKVLYKRVVKVYGKPDIVHAHFFGVGYLAAELKINEELPLVLTEHSSFISDDQMKPFLRKKAEIAYENADVVVAVSPFLQQVLKDKFALETIYVPNLIDTELFCIETKEEDEIFRFVSTANLIETKRIDLLIKAFALAFKADPATELTIFGEGERRAYLETLIKELDMKEQIALMGDCPRELIAAQLKKCDCFVLPSKRETFGLAYLEALACGVPVIATRCGGPEHFIGEDNGILVPVDDQVSLQEAMIYMKNYIDDYDREMISQAIKQEFSAESVAGKIITVYESLLK
jgi:L-malate glycosyltransferase